MGLFGKKDPCVFCGEKVKGLFPHKIENQYVCGDCYGVVDLPQGWEQTMTLEKFRRYMEFRAENDRQKEDFQINRKVDFGFFDTKMVFDNQKKAFCMTQNLGTTLFFGDEILSFIIKEDTVPLLEGSAAGLVHHTSTVPERAMAMMPQIQQMVAQRRMQENMEKMIDAMDGQMGNHQNRPQTNTYFNRDIPEPFQNFNLEIILKHSYWRILKADKSGPRFNNEYPDVNQYLREYERDVAVMEDLADALMQMILPDGAPINRISADQSALARSMNVAAGGMASRSMPNTVPATPVAAAGHDDVIAQIQKYKALMDQGILTEEEFAAKKKQILGI